MGYTHYWEHGTIKKEEYASALVDIKKVLDNLPVENVERNEKIGLFGWNGYGKPVFTEDLISFNGDASRGLSHETFYLNPHETTDFSFCKTRQAPYDFVVCCVLLALKKHITGFKYSSDGNATDWKPAKTFMNKLFKK